MTTEKAARQKGRKETGAQEIEENEGLEGAGAGKVQWNLAPRHRILGSVQLLSFAFKKNMNYAFSLNRLNMTSNRSSAL